MVGQAEPGEEGTLGGGLGSQDCPLPRARAVRRPPFLRTHLFAFLKSLLMVSFVAKRLGLMDLRTSLWPVERITLRPVEILILSVEQVQGELVEEKLRKEDNVSAGEFWSLCSRFSSISIRFFFVGLYLYWGNCLRWSSLRRAASSTNGRRWSSVRLFHLRPSSFEIDVFWMIGSSVITRRLSWWENTMNAFIGRLM